MLRAIRGATCLSANASDEMSDAVKELLTHMISSNDIESGDMVSIMFTATQDLTCAFPAAFAREIGLDDVPLMCAAEIDVTGALPRVVRVLMHINSERSNSDLTHVYLRGADVLRSDLSRRESTSD